MGKFARHFPSQITGCSNKPIDNRYGADLFKAPVQRLRPAGQGHDIPAAPLRVRVHGVFPLHGFPGDVYVHGTHRTRLGG